MPNSECSVTHVKEALEDFARRDDVYSDAFASTLILQPEYDVDIEDTIERVSRDTSFAQVYSYRPSTQDGRLPAGPYFIRSGSIHQAWRLYEDNLDAFIIPTITDGVLNPESFSVLHAVAEHGSFLSDAVPSRLYHHKDESKLLAGVRVSIKDNYDLAGIRTTMMNRAYNELYPPRETSADFVVKLLELGAVIVGKTKMSAFASAEEPTDQWVDYHCPFNPRGDGCQTPSCSSTGGRGLFGRLLVARSFYRQ
ncbi:2-oxoglutarate dehydrogenase, mitochondrial [Sphaceloma murrayae]|uniref:2-oxoglutarate dehydrogenase, mitochondrial n=1 Tax=Sphaceloma murrayae TaxID=2082308 RepID=A0A2K1QM47_9PEZI|nr:2-oxoglutarate dehydrogenase, mitochondrial [Sphaceloma murrayae]